MEYEITNSVEPDQGTTNEPNYLGLHCLYEKYMPVFHIDKIKGIFIYQQLQIFLLDTLKMPSFL